MLDLTQNAIEAGATHIRVVMEEKNGRLRVSVADNGSGMTRETQRRALDPFYSDGTKHKHRRVGLGLPFLKQLAEMTGGTMSLSSLPGAGTTVAFTVEMDHLDTPPIGDLPSTVLAMMNYPGTYDLAFERALNEHRYRVERSDLQEALDGLQTSGDLALAKTYLTAQEDELHQLTPHHEQ